MVKRCDTDSIDVNDLEWDYELQNITGYGYFTPELKTDNCPSPYVHVVRKEDVVSNPGTPCTTDYKTVQREWALDVHTDDVHLNCPVPVSDTFPFVQVFTLGGLEDEDGLPASPEFDLEPVTIFLPNVPEATVAADMFALFKDGIPPTSECGLCNNNTNAIFYDHVGLFGCDDHGNNTVSISAVNNIGIEVRKATVVTVIDDKPPNVVDSTKEVMEGGSVIGSISLWDNCYIQSYEIIENPAMGELQADLSLPDYEYSPSRGCEWLEPAV